MHASGVDLRAFPCTRDVTPDPVPALAVNLSEASVEDAALNWLRGLDWEVAHGPDISPDGAMAERSDYAEVLLPARLRAALARLSPDLPPSALDDAFRKLIQPAGATLEARNRVFHRMLDRRCDGGVPRRQRDPGRTGAGHRLRARPPRTTGSPPTSSRSSRATTSAGPTSCCSSTAFRLGVIELKNPTDENATVWTAWQQLQTYKSELPALFAMNAVLDRVRRHRCPHRHALGRSRVVQALADDLRRDPGRRQHAPELQVMLAGVCDRRRFPCPPARLRRLRGRRRRPGQEDGGLPPVSRRRDRGR